MTFHGETFQRVSIAEAARTLGVSPSTVRRMVKAGRLVGESVLRPQGSAYVVRLPLDVSTVTGAPPGTSQMPRGEERSRVSGQETDFSEESVSPAERMMTAWSTAVLTPILAPIVAELTATREQLVTQAETIGRQSERVAGLELENTRLSVALRAEREARSSLTASTAPESVEPTTDAPVPRWRAWWPWLLGLLAIVALVALVAWPR